MTSCVRCGHELGVGRFCTNCGHPVGEPVPDEAVQPPPDRPRAALPPWLPWVAGVVLVLLLGAVLASCLGDDEPAPEATDPGGSATKPGGDAATRPARTSDVARFTAVSAPTPASPTTDLDGDLVRYEARQMTDGVPQTCWRMPGDGTGAVIEFRLREATTITRVGLINGYAKVVADGLRQVDWYPQNRRIASVEWLFDDGTSMIQDLEMRPRMQVVRVDPVTTRTVRLRILGVTPPADGPLGRDYTPISDVALVGAPA